ncbi:MAG TPA: DUF3313 family protein [Casimicrobiaceae bacterium]|nr:DUF3313 family protein [Casimicrobiaceae bacterium]
MAAAQVGGKVASGGPDGLVQVKSRWFGEVYLRPGADFRGYTKVMLGPTQVAFAERWLSDLNEHRIAVLQGTTVADANRIAEATGSVLIQSFANVFKAAGYEIVTAPGADVLELSPRLVDLYINAPDTVTRALPASRVYTYNAGEATLVLEIRESKTGTLLARVVDHRTAGFHNAGTRRGVRVTTTPSNLFDFGSLFDLWASNCIDELKVWSPVALNAPVSRN